MKEHLRGGSQRRIDLWLWIDGVGGEESEWHHVKTNPGAWMRRKTPYNYCYFCIFSLGFTKAGEAINSSN